MTSFAHTPKLVTNTKLNIMQLNQPINLMRKISVMRQHDKCNESTREMLIRIGAKFIALSCFLLMFDLVLDLLLDVVHLLIEFIEYTLGVVLHNLFHINHQQSEVIIVNGALVISLYGLYSLYFSAPRLYTRSKRKCRAFLLRRIKQESAYWRGLSLERKTALIFFYLSTSYCLLFLFIF